MRTLYKALKEMAAEALRRTGILSRLVDTRLRKRVSVLMYHRIISSANLPATDSSPGIIVPEGDFEFQMRTLRQHFNPISLPEFEDHLIDGAPLPARSCLVTIDDGWIDNYETAFPILKKYSVPAVIFLPTDYISASRLFWQEEILMRLTWLLRSGDEARLAVLSSILQTDKPATSIDIDDIRSYVLRLKASDDSFIQKHLQQLRVDLAPFGEHDHYNRYMSWDQVKEMSEAGISFASHATSHRILCRLSDKECMEELSTSREKIEAKIGTKVRTIAYPNGDHDERVIGLARSAGYSVGLGTQSGLWSNERDPLSVPRMNIHGNNAKTEALFMATCVNLF